MNSDGGLLIWGAPVGEKDIDSKEKVFKGPLTPVSYQIESDQIISKIADEVSPTPLRILVQVIKTKNNAFYYVFEVAKSEFAPHQFRGSYFIRLDGSTRFAPHHYVEALIKKIYYPRLKVEVFFGELFERGSYIIIPIGIVINNLSELINELNVKYRILIDRACIAKGMEEKVTGHFDSGCDRVFDAMKTMHCMIPLGESFSLITKKLTGSQTKLINFQIITFGDLSPAITSIYELQISGEEYGQNPKLKLIRKEENSYLFNRANIIPGGNELAGNALVDKAKDIFYTLDYFKLLPKV